MVAARDNFYAPAAVSVQQGGSVCWTNQGANFHTVTSTTNVFASPTMPPGATFRFTFVNAGTFPYFCQIHGTAMSGTVRVLPKHP